MTPYDAQYDLTDDPNTDSGSGSVIESIFANAASVGTAYFASQTPQNASVAPYGTVNPNTGLPYGYQSAGMASSSNFLWIVILGVIAYFAFTKL